MPSPDATRPVRRTAPVVRRSDGPARRQHPRPPLLTDTPGPDRATPVEAVKLTVAIIERPHGVRGEFQASLISDTPERLLTLKSIFLGDETRPRQVQACRRHQDRLVFKLAGIDSPEQVKGLSKTPLRIPGQAAAPLREGEFFIYQLIDSTVLDESGAELGKLVDIMETGANEVYVIRMEGSNQELLLPNIPSVVLDIDIEHARITVRPPEYF